ncbi:hypothetical protein EB001_02115 [bacterium]|nr:hypothetical protein [bacterium]
MTITKELIDKIVNGKNVNASNEVIDILYHKAISQLDDYKQQVALQLMNTKTEEQIIKNSIEKEE